MKAVFIASSHSAYDDRPGELYHFPNRNYLSVAAKTVGDWVIFYQGRRGGISGYYAVQRVERIVPDPTDPSHSYAILDRASLLSFERPVPRFRANNTPYERGLPKARGKNTSSVRLISDADFAAIIDEGLREDITPDTLPREGPLPQPLQPGFAEAQTGFVPLGNADRVQILASRAFRDRAFARQVKSAYGARCAMSGLMLRNGGGRPEVEAAHIVPVEARGPDTVRNGLALSGTVHWMFDRGLVSVDDDMTLLIAKDSVASDIAARLFVPDRRLILPADAGKAPHPAYLKWHRDTCFKG
ncbi:HNH endonuclease [Tabrizicola oligotrophica]|uniref:HNH endonuclease n=1 Tax=Tabrizicola oligotrophica TaxID=2710650 RepID=A0A6M0QW58_9RHOB|nr:HNH endonuclease [Tabrizicola oligotrophica]NEY90732.1 HNH endonuclease [Tabrizicola oligotrophica]